MEIINIISSELSIPLAKIIILIIIAFSAGFVDAVVGGGGLILVPGLINVLPNFPIPTLFGTNKIASVAGTTLAAYKYSQKVKFNWRWLFPAFILSVFSAIVGGALASVVPTHIFRPIILVFLLWVAYLSFFPKKIKDVTVNVAYSNHYKIIGVCSLIAFYDGFIGPGTGVFLIFVFVQYFGQSFLQASANAKLINVASNIGALIFFIPSGHFLWKIALLLLICNVGGAYLGSYLAIAKGSKFVGMLFKIMVSLLLARFLYDSVLILLSSN